MYNDKNCIFIVGMEFDIIRKILDVPKIFRIVYTINLD